MRETGLVLLGEMDIFIGDRFSDGRVPLVELCEWSGLGRCYVGQDKEFVIPSFLMNS